MKSAQPSPDNPLPDCFSVTVTPLSPPELIFLTPPCRHAQSRHMATQEVIPIERIASRTYLIRGERVMLDSDLAELYGIPTNRLNEQVWRNNNRFPRDFAFRLTHQEFAALRSQFAKSTGGRGRRPKLPWVFNEHGVAMLSSMLRSERAVRVNLAIIRAFVRLRRMISSHHDLARIIEEHDRQIGMLFDMLRDVLPPLAPEKRPIGLITPEIQGAFKHRSPSLP